MNQTILNIKKHKNQLDIHTFAQELEQLAFQGVELPESIAQILRNFYCKYETDLEYKQARENIPSLQIDRTYEYAKQECEITNITKRSRVAFIGSGPYPETALAISHNTGAEIVCIDSDEEAILLSEEKNTDTNISFLHNDGKKH